MMRKSAAAAMAMVLIVGLTGCGSSTGQGSAPSKYTVTSTEQTTTTGNVRFKLEGEWKEEILDQGIKFANADGAYITVVNSRYDSFATETGMEAVQTYFLQFEDAGGSIGAEVVQNAVGDAPLWQYTYTTDGDDDPMSGMGVIYLTGNEMSVIQVGAPEEVYDDVKPMLDEIIDGIEYLSKEPLVTSVEQANSGTATQQDNEEASETVKGGTHLVGTDIVAGTYKLTANADSGYWEIKESVDADAEIVANDIFENSTYVTVEDGQYIDLSDCTGVLQK